MFYFNICLWSVSYGMIFSFYFLQDAKEKQNRNTADSLF